MAASVEYWLEKIFAALDGAVDDDSGSTIIVDHAHHEVHEGSHFFVSGYSELDSAGAVSFALTTPNTDVQVHMLWTIAAAKGCTVVVYENADISDGTPVIPFNSNRRVVNLSDATLVQDPTINSVGFALAQAKFGTAGTPRFAPTGGSITRGSELVLKANTTYLWLITSNEDTNIISYSGEWYELGG